MQSTVTARYVAVQYNTTLSLFTVRQQENWRKNDVRTKDTLYLAVEGQLWGVFYKF